MTQETSYIDVHIYQSGAQQWVVSHHPQVHSSLPAAAAAAYQMYANPAKLLRLTVIPTRLMGATVIAKPEPAPDDDLPEIVCLCGSTRFMAEYRKEMRRLSLEGCIVLTVSIPTHKLLLNQTVTEQEKQRLYELHRKKIRLADRIHVINVSGYIGEQTCEDIAYANSLGKPITYLEPVD